MRIQTGIYAVQKTMLFKFLAFLEKKKKGEKSKLITLRGAKLETSDEQLVLYSIMGQRVKISLMYMTSFLASKIEYVEARIAISRFKIKTVLKSRKIIKYISATISPLLLSCKIEKSNSPRADE
jgi:hypothetical protein